MTRNAETHRVEDAAVLAVAAQTGGRMAAEDRRLQIVQVALRLFSERGFRGTTTKEIAQAAGVSEAIIFRHFATKDELYTAIIDYKGCAGLGASPVKPDGARPAVVESICGVAGEAISASDDRAVFQSIALSMLEHHQSDPDFLRLLMYLALEGHSLVQIFWDKNVRVLYEFLGGYVRRRQREGAFRDVDPYAAIRVFLGTIIHHSLTQILWDKDPARRIFNVSNEEAARAFTEILLRGIAADPGVCAPPAKHTDTKRTDTKHIDAKRTDTPKRAAVRGRAITAEHKKGGVVDNKSKKR
jgi:AcrR family transcriptional regulator